MRVLPAGGWPGDGPGAHPAIEVWDSWNVALWEWWCRAEGKFGVGQDHRTEAQHPGAIIHGVDGWHAGLFRLRLVYYYKIRLAVFGIVKIIFVNSAIFGNKCLISRVQLSIL